MLLLILLLRRNKTISSESDISDSIDSERSAELTEEKESKMTAVIALRTELRELSTEADNVTRMRSILEVLNKQGTLENWLDRIPDEYRRTIGNGSLIEIHPNMKPKEASHLFYKYATTMQVKCPRAVRVGTNVDGGWDVCLSEQYNVKTPCLVYSIGMGILWSFDYDITKKYGYANMAYDPTIQKISYKPSELLWFHDLGLAGDNFVDSHNWTMRTFERLLELSGHTEATIDILKMDIEFAEWAAIESMLVEVSLRNVKQFVFEFHTKELKRIRGKTSSSDFTYYWLLLRGLDAIGFKIWKFLPNECCPGVRCCGLLHFININYIVR